MPGDSEEFWRRCDALFSRALEADESQREAFVDLEANGNTALASQVKSLLRTSAVAARFWDHAAPRVIAGLWRDLADGRESDDVDARDGALGPYRLLTRIARGGMGSVYLAERADGRFDQRVAVKILRRGLDTEDIIERFLAERRVLASLEHPNIAHLLDGGETPDGRPYLVMELVDGKPITTWCDDACLTVPERLKLFVQTGRAVQHAHRHLVVHRDIKPSNVFVTGGPGWQVKLLDFGIAKIIDPDDHVHGKTTRTSGRLMTPGYASPEQILGNPVTTASDVYQLGLLLHELLAGSHPFGAGSVDSAELQRRILIDDPPPPSRVVNEEGAKHRGTDLRRLRRLLSGDLDRVTLMALCKEPNHRYNSVDQLLEDLDRVRRGIPVQAAAHTVRYRASRFIRRNLWALAATTTGFCLVTAHAITLTIQNHRVAEQRDRAAQEARKAASVSDFMVRLFEAADPNQNGGRQLRVDQVLEVGARQASAELGDQPDLRAALLSAIGRSYAGLGQMSEARNWLEQAVTAQRAAHGKPHEAIAEDLAALAGVGGEYSVQIASYQEALTMAEDAAGSDHPLTGKILAEYGTVLSGDPARVEESRRMRERAVVILRNAPPEYREDLSNALTASAYGVSGGPALRRMAEALAIRRELHGNRHTAVAASLNDLALATEESDPLAADSLMEEAVAILADILGEAHGRTLTGLNNLAALRRDRGAYSAAESTYRAVIEIRRREYPDRPVELAYPTYGLGRVLTALGRPAEGEGQLRVALVLLEKGGVLADNALTHLTKAAIGHALARQRRYTEGERFLIPAANRLREIPVGTIDRSRVLGWAAELYQSWGREGEANLWLARLEALEAPALGPTQIPEQ